MMPATARWPKPSTSTRSPFDFGTERQERALLGREARHARGIDTMNITDGSPAAVLRPGAGEVRRPLTFRL